MKILVTYVNIRIKNYLKVLYTNLNSPQGEAVPYQIVANALIKNIIFNFKKTIKKVYSDFSKVTLVPCSSMDTTHSTVSPGSTSKNFRTCCGIINLAESNLLLPFPTLDLNLNIGITSFIYVYINIYGLNNINITV